MTASQFSSHRATLVLSVILLACAEGLLGCASGQPITAYAPPEFHDDLRSNDKLYERVPLLVAPGHRDQQLVVAGSAPPRSRLAEVCGCWEKPVAGCIGVGAQVTFTGSTGPLKQIKMALFPVAPPQSLAAETQALSEKPIQTISVPVSGSPHVGLFRVPVQEVPWGPDGARFVVSIMVEYQDGMIVFSTIAARVPGDQR